MNFRNFLLSIGLLSSLLGDQAMANPLETAKKIAAGDLKGWTYGANEVEQEIDCVTFLIRVVEKELGRKVSVDERLGILISHGWTAEEIQSIADEGNDLKLDGVVHTLVDLSKVAERVEPLKAKPGDFIQYWMKKKDGTWFGHAAVVCERKGDRVRLFGAHKSLGRVGESSFLLNLKGSHRRFALARMKEEKR
jgi:hypothetical protein